MQDRFRVRAWHKEKQKWVYGPTDDAPSPSWVLAAAPLFDDLIFQCTGLKDKNGKLIWEGDILSWAGKNHTVVWCDFEASFFIGLDTNRVMAANGEVIGSIYENPELLNT